MIFSVIVPFLNEEQYIERCLTALVEQEFDRSEYEVIAIDNGSTDRSGEIVERFDSVTLLSEPAGNAYTARNRAIDMAEGQIVAFTDADGQVCHDWLMKIHEKMQHPPTQIVLGCICFPPTCSSSLKVFEHYEQTKIEYLVEHTLKQYYYGYGGNMAVRRALFEKIGKFGEFLGGDSELVCRCLQQEPSANIAFCRDMRMVHLEIADLRSWFRKYQKYGMNAGRLRGKSTYHPLTFRLRLQVLRSCFEKFGYSNPKKIHCAGMMLLGLAHYVSGVVRREKLRRH